MTEESVSLVSRETVGSALAFLAGLVVLASAGAAQGSPLPLFSPPWIAALGAWALAVLWGGKLFAAVQTPREAAWHENVADRDWLEEKAWIEIDRDGRYRKARGYSLRFSVFEGARYGLAWLERPGLLPEFAVVSLFPSKKGHVLRSPVFSFERASRLLDEEGLAGIAAAHFPSTPEAARMREEVARALREIKRERRQGALA